MALLNQALAALELGTHNLYCDKFEFVININSMIIKQGTDFLDVQIKYSSSLNS